ncbi:MAG: protein kinase [Actinobacteria bacterium]|nr:protein kinase [Actinomycetota bacterium]
MTSPRTADAPKGDDPCPHCGHEVGDSWLVCAWCGERLAVAAEMEAGTRVGDGRYQILRVIGRGGFGITYDVGDRRLQRRVAMKELFPESAVRHGSMVLTPPQGRAGFKVARDRFMREARVLARFTHPGIVRVYEVFEEHGTAYLVMELLEGRTLVELLQQRGRPFPEAELLDVAGRVAAALRPVHAAGVLHRDINPSNVMLTHHGRIVVIDFGLARDYDQQETQGMTRVVTPGYAPLEQYRGEGRFGPSTDVYGLAATCYRLATGRVPVSAVERDAGASLPSPHHLNPAISKSVSDAILDGLELEPSHRPQDLDSLLARLGITRLPEGPRSSLIDLVPPPAQVEPSAPAPTTPEIAPAPASPPAPAPRPIAVVTPRHRPAPAPAPTEIAAVGSDDDRTVHAPLVPRTVAGGPDVTIPQSSGPSVDATSRPDATRPLVDRTDVPPPQFRPARAPVDVAVVEPRYRVVDGLPRPVGPHPAGRRAVLVPLCLLAIAAGSAAPVIVFGVLVLLVLPALATMGDTAAHRMRGESGAPGGWAERRMSSGALAAPRFARNVVLSVVRSSPITVGVGVALLGWYGLGNVGVSPALSDAALRAIGAVACGVVTIGAGNGSARFRSGLGTDDLVTRVTPTGRTSERVVVLWLLCAAGIAGALWLSPSAFPLP